MPDFIPSTEVDRLPSQLQAQFDSLKNILLQNNQNDDSLTEDNAICSSRDDTATKMALSIAISVQREIDGLLNGITELENILEDDENSLRSTNNTCICYNDDNITNTRSNNYVTNDNHSSREEK